MNYGKCDSGMNVNLIYAVSFPVLRLKTAVQLCTWGELIFLEYCVLNLARLFLNFFSFLFFFILRESAR